MPEQTNLSIVSKAGMPPTELGANDEQSLATQKPNRKEISAKKLQTFIDEATAITVALRPLLHGHSEEAEPITLSRIENVAMFLDKADEAGIINLTLWREKHPWVGMPERFELASQPSLLPVDQGIAMNAVREQLVSSAGHVRNMAQAIMAEATEDEASKRITQPYDQNVWQPAKLSL